MSLNLPFVFTTGAAWMPCIYLEEMAVEVGELTGVITRDIGSVGCRPWGRRNIVVQGQVSLC